MSVEFNEGPVDPVRRRPAESRYSFPMRLVLKSGIVRTEQGASVVLFIVAVIALLLAYVVFSRFAVEPPAATPEELKTTP